MQNIARAPVERKRYMPTSGGGGGGVRAETKMALAQDKIRLYSSLHQNCLRQQIKQV